MKDMCIREEIKTLLQKTIETKTFGAWGSSLQRPLVTHTSHVYSASKMASVTKTCNSCYFFPSPFHCSLKDCGKWAFFQKVYKSNSELQRISETTIQTCRFYGNGLENLLKYLSPDLKRRLASAEQFIEKWNTVGTTDSQLVCKQLESAIGNHNGRRSLL